MFLKLWCYYFRLINQASDNYTALLMDIHNIYTSGYKIILVKSTANYSGAELSKHFEAVGGLTFYIETTVYYHIVIVNNKKHEDTVSLCEVLLNFNKIKDASYTTQHLSTKGEIFFLAVTDTCFPPLTAVTEKIDTCTCHTRPMSAQNYVIIPLAEMAQLYDHFTIKQ